MRNSLILSQMKYLLFLFVFCLSACNLSSPTMTSMAFERIPIGAPVTEIEGEVGAPYRIASQDEAQRYYYIERIQTGPNTNAQNTYILIVKDGIVVNKQCLNESTSLNLQVR